MPLYEFRCATCKRTLEVIQKTNDKNPTCKHCKLEMRKQLGTFGFSISGGGVYRQGFSVYK